MNAPHKKLLIKLTREKRFPMDFENTTSEERTLVSQIMTRYKVAEIKNVIKTEALKMKAEGLI